MVKRKKQKKEPKVIMEYDFSKKEGEKTVCPEVLMREKNQRSESAGSRQEERPKPKVSSTSKPKSYKKREDSKKEEKLRQKEEKKERIRNDIEAPINETIESLLDSEKTFIENITRNAKKSPFSAFYPFPKNITYLSIGKREAVVLIVRHHWIALVPKGILAFLALFFPFLISYSVPTWFEGTIGSTFFLIGLFLFFLMISATILVDSFLKWFFQMNIITTRRIIDIDFVSITSHRVSETTFEQIQDVTHSPMGPFASFFDYGDVFVQTAGTKNEFEFNKAPRPRDVQDTIWDLKELRKKKFAGIK